MFLCMHLIYLLQNGWTNLVDFCSSVLVRRWYLVKKFWSLSPFFWKTGKIYLRAIFQLLYTKYDIKKCSNLLFKNVGNSLRGVEGHSHFQKPLKPSGKAASKHISYQETCNLFWHFYAFLGTYCALWLKAWERAVRH